MKEGMKKQSGSEIQLHFFDEKKNCSFCFNCFFFFCFNMLFHVKSSFSLLKYFPPKVHTTHAHTPHTHTIKRSGQPPRCFIKGAWHQYSNTNISLTSLI